MHKTLVALALILSTSFASLTDYTVTSTNALGSATAGWTVTGAANDKIGHLIADIGDFNNDGQPDYAVVSQTTIPKVYVILGKSGGQTASLDLSGTSGTTFYTITLPSAYPVTALAGGDLNGDGSADLAIGVGSKDRVFVIYGKGTNAAVTWTGGNWADYTIVDDDSLGNAKGFVVKGAVGSHLGQTIAIGDFADTTMVDLILGMTGWTETTTKGAVCVVFGRTWGASTSVAATRGSNPVDCADQAKLNAITGPVNVFEGQIIKGVTTDEVGDVVAAGSDFNGDGNEDIFISSKVGTKAYVVYGKANARVTAAVTEIDLAATNTNQADFLVINTPAGASITSANFIGNFNGDTDRRSDLALGHPTGGATNRGKVYVLFGYGTNPTTAYTLASLTAAQGISYTGKVDNGYFGQAVDGPGDVNTDGSADMIVSAPLADSARSASGAVGRVYVIYGSASNNKNVDLASDTLNGVTYTGAAQTGFGASISSAGGNIGGDTSADFLVGAPLATKSDTVANTGIVYEFRGVKNDVPASPGSGFRLHASLLVLASFFVALMF